MKEKLFQTCSKNKINKKLGENYSIDISINSIEYSLAADSLFKLAARKNIKRGFLFVSTVLGKHIPVSANISLLVSKLLAYNYYNLCSNEKISIPAEVINVINEYNDLDLLDNMFEGKEFLDNYIKLNNKAKKIYNSLLENKLELSEKTLFIGFAETATGLGHSVYENFKGNIAYIHTTREILVDFDSAIDFQEEHSHATDHFLYADLNNYDKVVLIDDEFTTGKTALNFIKELNSKFGIKKFSLLSLLDWRLDEHFENVEKFSNDYSVEIDSACILKGEIFTSGDLIGIKDYYKQPFVENIFRNIPWENLDFKKDNNMYKSVFNKLYNKSVSYLKDTGRFSVNPFTHNTENIIFELTEVINNVFTEKKLSDKNILFVGTEELIYIPMKIASNFDNAFYQSTTRSPIYASNTPQYGVKNSIEFSNPYDLTTSNFLYNINNGFYDSMFIFFEKSISNAGLDEFKEKIKQFEFNNIYLIEFENTKTLELK